MRTAVVSGILLLSVLGACATVPVLAPPAFRYEIVDDLQNRQFVIRLTSEDDRALCVEQDKWPAVGQDDIVTDPYFIQTAGGELRPKHWTYSDSGMTCGQSDDPDCGHFPIAAHATIETRLDYALYGDPEVLANDTSRHITTFPNKPDVKVCESRRP